MTTPVNTYLDTSNRYLPRFSFQRPPVFFAFTVTGSNCWFNWLRCCFTLSLLAFTLQMYEVFLETPNKFRIFQSRLCINISKTAFKNYSPPPFFGWNADVQGISGREVFVQHLPYYSLFIHFSHVDAVRPWFQCLAHCVPVSRTGRSTYWNSVYQASGLGVPNSRTLFGTTLHHPSGISSRTGDDRGGVRE